ncbi:Uncharacterised protein [Klebsiella pneumoniae]|nr:Uncharacterised protein [Klebsiella pneumoniae]
MMSLWDALRMNMMISYQELVRTFPRISPNMERSEFSFYNADKLINANISYAFWVVE